MELKRLETIPSSGNAPVSVINTYLNAINKIFQNPNLETKKLSGI